MGDEVAVLQAMVGLGLLGIAIVSCIVVRAVAEERRGLTAAAIVALLIAAWLVGIRDLLFAPHPITPTVLGISVAANIGFLSYIVGMRRDHAPERPTYRGPR